METIIINIIINIIIAYTILKIYTIYLYMYKIVPKFKIRLFRIL